MAVARINGKIISWALRRSGATLESLAFANVSSEKIAAWERGDEFPSEGQAEALAKRLGIAYPMLYMANVPPDEPIKVPDLRTFDGRPLTKPSPALLEVLDSTRARQNWYRDEAKEIGRKPLVFVGKFSVSDPTSTIAFDMRAAFDIGASTRRESRDYESFLKSLVTKAEDLGILVMRSAIVGHATRRTLSTKEFRGFALPDRLAPVVFINDNDAKAAQIFTLAHELAHIWLGASGISDRPPDEKGASTNPIDIKCDQIAAEFLVPEREIRALWKNAPLDSNLIGATRRFNVSSLVILRRAKDSHLISSGTFFAKINEQYELYKRREKEDQAKTQRTEKKNSGNFWNSFEIRNGRKFNAAVAIAVKEQRTTYAEAGNLFGINPVAAAKYLLRIGAK